MLEYFWIGIESDLFGFDVIGPYRGRKAAIAGHRRILERCKVSFPEEPRKLTLGVLNAQGDFVPQAYLDPYEPDV